MSASPTSSQPRRRADYVRNRALLLDAARDAFAAEGLGVPVTEIVRRAGLAKGTFFTHFGTKDELIHMLMLARLERVTAIARRISDSREPGWETLRAMIEDAHKEIAHDRSFPESVRHPSVEAPDMQAALRAQRDEIDHALMAAQDKGEVRADVTCADIGAIMLSASLHADQPHLGRRCLRVFLDGLRPQHTTDLDSPARLTPYFAKPARRR